MIGRTIGYVVLAILFGAPVTSGAEAKYAATLPAVIGGRIGNIYLGWGFRVNVPIKITAIGAADLDIDGVGYCPVWLWDEQERSLLGLYQLNNGNSVLEGPVSEIGSAWSAMCQFRYMYLDTPVELCPGRTYAIVGLEDNNRIGLGIPFVPDEITFLAERMTYNPGDYPINRGGSEGWFGPNFKFERIAQTVGIDIKPGSYPNSFNNDGHGIIPVAILGSSTLDVSQINVSTLSLEGLALRLKGNGAYQCSIRDVSGNFSNTMAGEPDGYPDLVCQFVDEDGIWSQGQTNATVTGELTDGTPITGSDSINITQ